MKPSHLAVLSATLVSFAVVAQDKPKQEPSAQSGQTQAQTESKQPSGQQQAATEQKGQKSGAQASQSPEVVKQAQEKLSAAGHDPGPADGMMGPRTEKALKDFQQAKKLDASGQLDQKTLAALGVSAEATSAATGATAPDKPKEPSAGASAGAGAAGEKPKEPSAGAAAGTSSQKPKQ